jgi:hypothetical protein
MTVKLARTKRKRRCLIEIREVEEAPFVPLHGRCLMEKKMAGTLNPLHGR